MVKTGTRLLSICNKHRVPLLIHDRLDVAFAMKADGVHLGPGDMSILRVRKVLGNAAVIGISVSSVEEAITAQKHGADYLSVKTILGTVADPDTRALPGTSDASTILKSLAHPRCPVIAIGDIKCSNIQAINHIEDDLGTPVEGAVVRSAIMSAADPRAAAADLLSRSKRARQQPEPLRLTDGQIKTPKIMPSELSNSQVGTPQPVTPKPTKDRFDEFQAVNSRPLKELASARQFVTPQLTKSTTKAPRSRTPLLNHNQGNAPQTTPLQLTERQANAPNLCLRSSQNVTSRHPDPCLSHS